MSASPVFHHIFPAMHTRFSMVLPGVDRLTGEWLAAEVETIVQSQERLLSRFDPRSPLSELNRRAALEPVRPPAPLWDVLQICREHWRRTGGAFDIAQTARTELQRDAVARGADPSPEELRAAGERCGFGQVQFDDDAGTVRFAAPGLCLDLGAIGKGLALEAVGAALRRQGVTSGFLSFGESSIAVIGSHPSGPHWPVGVADLYRAGHSWHRFELRDAALSTSGNRASDGHIVDPRNGQPVTGRRTLSVACASAAHAEVLSTALLVVPVPERAELLRNYMRTEAVEIIYDPGNGGWSGRISWYHGA
jgi:thiamine biosynthesis lipoprotein